LVGVGAGRTSAVKEEEMVVEAVVKEVVVKEVVAEEGNSIVVMRLL
jgi:hypothetical protein